MPRKQKSEPQRPVRALYPPTTIQQDTRHLPARANVLGTVELLERIFSHVSQADLILNIQGVCHLWKDIVANIPETFLDKVPPVAPSRNPAQQFNPLLFQHFRALYGVTMESSHIVPRKAKLDVSKYCYDPAKSFFDKSKYYKLGCVAGCKEHVHGMSISITANAPAEHRKFTHANASWRRMQLASPPITKVRYKRVFSETEQTVKVPEGLRMGALYDLVVYGGLVGNKNDERLTMDIEWTSRQRRTRQQVESEERRVQGLYVDDIDAYGLEESPNYYSLGNDSDSDSDGDDDNKRLPKVAVHEIHITGTYSRCHAADVRLNSMAHVAGRRLLCSGIQERELIVKP